MNREIKFKFWSKTLNKMFLPSGNLEYSWEEATPCLTQWIEYNREDDFSFDNDLIILQFTGFLDKNNKEIYEGDIVKVKDVYGEVVIKNGMTYIESESNLVGFNGWPLLWLFEKDRNGGMEVAGNILENLELLK